MVDRVVDFLDVESALRLGHSHMVALKAVQRPSVWNKLIRQSGLQSNVPEKKSQENLGLLAYHEKKLQELDYFYSSTTTTLLPPLLAVMKLSKGPHKRMMQQLTKVICEVFAFDVELVDRFDMKIPCPFQSYNTPGLVCFSSTSVSPLGFLLLQHLEVEGLEVERFDVSPLGEPLLSALSRRVAIQQTVKWSDSGVHVICNTSQSALDFCLIVEKCQALNIFVLLRVGEEIGLDGWSALAKAAEFLKQKSPSQALNGFVFTTRKAMVQGGRGDLRSIWDSMPEGCWWNVSRSGHEKYNRKITGWAELEQVLDQSEEDWDKQLYDDYQEFFQFSDEEEVELSLDEDGEEEQEVEFEDFGDEVV